MVFIQIALHLTSYRRKARALRLSKRRPDSSRVAVHAWHEILQEGEESDALGSVVSILWIVFPVHISLLDTFS